MAGGALDRPFSSERGVRARARVKACLVALPRYYAPSIWGLVVIRHLGSLVSWWRTPANSNVFIFISFFILSKLQVT